MKAVFIKVIGSFCVVAGTAILFAMLVWNPFQQNRWLKYATHHVDTGIRSQAAARRSVIMLERNDLWPPYLKGVRDLYRARLYRYLQNHDSALEAYEDAVRGRTLPDARIELGLYELQVGMTARGERRLSTAARFSPLLLREIPPHGLRERIAAEANKP